MTDDLYRPPTITAEVAHVDEALVEVRLYVERPGGRRASAGYCELHPSVWRTVRHALAVGLSMTGARLTVRSDEAPAPYTLTDSPHT